MTISYGSVIIVATYIECEPFSVYARFVDTSVQRNPGLRQKVPTIARYDKQCVAIVYLTPAQDNFTATSSLDQ